jgi:hypothetical protein
MKIGFFGNTNNAPLMVAHALRELGREVLLVVTSPDQLHRPESRHPEFKKGYPAWIMDAAHVSEWDFMTLNPSIVPVLDTLSTCDALILNNFGPSLWPLLGRPSIAFLTGSDVSYYANLATVDVRTTNWSSDYRMSAAGQMNMHASQDLIQRQREGICQAVVIVHLPRGVVPGNDAILDELGLSESKRFFQYIAELQMIKPAPAPHNSPIRIFTATRLTWKLPIELGRSLLDYKGSDIMIRGLGLFFRQTGVRLDIRLIKKGLHIVAAEQLIADEGLSDQVTWLEEMSLTDVWSEFARCDIVIEQLADSAIGMAGMDALATGRPVIGNGRSELFQSYFGQPSPICQARTAEEVCAQLKRLVFDAEEREKRGVRGRQFVEEHCNLRSYAQTTLKRLETAMARNKELIGMNPTAHSYYLQRSYESRQEVQTLQQALQERNVELQNSKVEIQISKDELQAAQAQLARYQSFLLVRLARKLSRLCKHISFWH